MAGSVLWATALYLLLFSAYVVGGVVGILLYPRPESSFTRFWLLVIVGILFALAALYNPCIREVGMYNAERVHRCGDMKVRSA